jgi:cyclophilin family peptidyl-prolyl cis-trans isomerase
MRWTIWLTLAVATLGGACAPGEERPPAETSGEAGANPVVVLETNLGDIVIELEPARAPETVRHFLRHVRSRFYDSVMFHRVVPGFVVQAGGYMPDMRERKTSAYPIANENPTGLTNLRGTVAMARQSDPHSALVDFYINLADNPRLDFRDSTAAGFGYVVFGRVLSGMEVADSLARIPTRPRNRLTSVPVEPVVIRRAYVKEAS